MKSKLVLLILISGSLSLIYSCSEKESTGTCGDGIKNQTEAGVDCGGPCTAVCPTCTDGIMNQGETSIDCGGPCTTCPTCSDGIKNQGETDVDCGGPCTACPSCSDGIQNQGEVNVDCGGPCAACVPFSFKVDGTLISVGGGVMHANVDNVIEAYHFSPSPFYHMYLQIDGDTLLTNVNYNLLTPPANYTSMISYEETGGYYDVIISGNLKYTKLDYINNKATGVFSFVVSDGSISKTITEGKFTDMFIQQ